MTVVGEMPPNRCYDGFKNLKLQAEETRIGAEGYLARLRVREKAAAPREDTVDDGAQDSEQE